MKNSIFGNKKKILFFTSSIMVFNLTFLSTIGVFGKVQTLQLGNSYPEVKYNAQIPKISTDSKTKVPIKINNPNLEAIIRKILKRPKGAIYRADLSSIYKLSINTLFYSVCKADEFFRAPLNSINLMFFGSSHCYRSINPEIFDKDMNINSFNLGISGQPPYGDYYEMQEVLKYQKPKVIVYEIYWRVFEIRPDKTKGKYSLEKFKPNPCTPDTNTWLKKLFVYKSSFYAWLRLLNQNQLSYQDYYKTKGFVYSDHMATSAAIAKDTTFNNPDKLNFNKDELDCFYKMISLCKKKNINLVFITAPIPPTSLAKVKNYSKIHDYFQKIADVNNIHYIDYNYLNKDCNIFNDSNFIDAGHLNVYGATILSNLLSTYIKETYYKK